MKSYEIKKSIATFGVGMVLELTEEQAETRKDSISKKGKYYIVNSPITFKCGEKVNVISGEVSKTLIENLKDLNNYGNKEDNLVNSKSNKNTNGSQKQKEDEEDSNDGKDKTDDKEFPSIKHTSFGNYEVFDSTGEKITEKPIKKAEAEKLLEELIKELKKENSV